MANENGSKILSWLVALTTLIAASISAIAGFYISTSSNSNDVQPNNQQPAQTQSNSP